MMLIVSLVVFQIIIFGALIFFLKKILTRNVVNATRHLDELNQDYTKKEEEAARLLDEARQESQNAIEKARAEAEDIKQKMIADAGKEGENMVKQARVKSEDMIQQADKARQLLLSDINDRISKEAVVKAAELIQHTLPDNFKREVHSQWVKDLIESGFKHIEGLNIPKDVTSITVTSAFELDDSERKVLYRKIKEVMGRDLELKEAADPALVAGIIISVGSLVLDGSLKNRIQEQAKSVRD